MDSDIKRSATNILLDGNTRESVQVHRALSVQEGSIYQIEIKGYFYKLSPKTAVGWQKRWFTLDNEKLKYWKDEKLF